LIARALLKNLRIILVIQTQSAALINRNCDFPAENVHLPSFLRRRSRLSKSNYLQQEESHRRAIETLTTDHQPGIAWF